RALRHEFQLELAGFVHLVEYDRTGTARETADDLAHASCRKQTHEWLDAAGAGIVADERQVLGPLLNETIDQMRGMSHRAEAAEQDGRTVLDPLHRLGDGLDPLVDHEFLLPATSRAS